MPMSPSRGFFAVLCAAAMLPAQNAPKKQLTARELFYAAPQAPAPPKPTAAPKAPPKAVTRVNPPPPKTVEVARAEPQPPSQTKDPVVKVAAQTAPLPASGAPPLGLRYTILKMNSDNSTTDVAPDMVFHSGDRIRFSVESNAPGYLYIVNQGSSGNWKPMFPSP